MNQLPDITPSSSSKGPDSLLDFWGPPISIYTRQDAIDDGVLVDVSEWAGPGPSGMLRGFRVPVAFTRALWTLVDLGVIPDCPWARQARRRGESTRGRAHDVLWMAALWARRAEELDRFSFVVLITQSSPRGRLLQTRVRLEARTDGDGVTIGFREDF